MIGQNRQAKPRFAIMLHLHPLGFYVMCSGCGAELRPYDAGSLTVDRLVYCDACVITITRHPVLPLPHD